MRTAKLANVFKSFMPAGQTIFITFIFPDYKLQK